MIIWNMHSSLKNKPIVHKNKILKNIKTIFLQYKKMLKSKPISE